MGQCSHENTEYRSFLETSHVPTNACEIAKKYVYDFRLFDFSKLIFQCIFILLDEMYLIRNNGTSTLLVVYTGCSISDGICLI